MSVYLVGAGPGEGDLLTVRAARLLGEADVVVRDRLIDASVMEFVNPLAVVVDVGKSPGDSSSQSSINELLVELAATHETVVRLLPALNISSQQVDEGCKVIAETLELMAAEA